MPNLEFLNVIVWYYKFMWCLQKGGWADAKRLCMHLEALGLTPMQHEIVGKALCSRISEWVRPMAKALLPLGLRGPSVLDEKVFCKILAAQLEICTVKLSSKMCFRVIKESFQFN